MESAAWPFVSDTLRKQAFGGSKEPFSSWTRTASSRAVFESLPTTGEALPAAVKVQHGQLPVSSTWLVVSHHASIVLILIKLFDMTVRISVGQRHRTDEETGRCTARLDVDWESHGWWVRIPIRQLRTHD